MARIIPHRELEAENERLKSYARVLESRPHLVNTPLGAPKETELPSPIGPAPQEMNMEDEQPIVEPVMVRERISRLDRGLRALESGRGGHAGKENGRVPEVAAFYRDSVAKAEDVPEPEQEQQEEEN